MASEGQAIDAAWPSPTQAGASTKQNVTDSGKTALRSQLGPRLHSVTIPDAGHNLLGDAFDETASEISRFLNKRSVAAE